MEGNRKTRLKDFVGLNEDVSKKVKFAIDQLKNPWACKNRGCSMRSILLYGLPGTGKTMLASVIANEAGVPFYVIQSATGLSVDSGEGIADTFLNAHRQAASVILLDSIDRVDPDTESELKTIMDRHGKPASEEGFLLVIAATNCVEALSNDLCQKFPASILLGVPNHVARADILSMLTRDKELDCHAIAGSTIGFVGRDLKDLVDAAWSNASQRDIALDISKQLDMDESGQQHEQSRITMADCEKAVENIQPSLSKQAFYAIPKTKWEDIGGHDSLRQAFNRYIVKRIKDPESFVKLKLNLETGFMLFGPLGCGKSLVAQAVANEAGANFFHVKCPKLLKSFEESELAVRALFNRARACTPCILFFDKVDMLVVKISKVKRLFDKLTEELDRRNQQEIFVIGSTHRIAVLNSSLTDPGRFSKLHYIRLPSEEDRASILQVLSRNGALDSEDVDLNSIAGMEACQNLSGADLNELMTEASIAALDDGLTVVKQRHLENALSKISPSISAEDIQSYENAWERIERRRRLLI